MYKFVCCVSAVRTLYKASVPLFQVDLESVGPFGGNFSQIQPSVKSASVI